MTFGNFRLGMRTIKTAIACLICILLFHFTNRGTPMIACLAAVFALRQDFNTTIKFGSSRIIANTIGGIFAVLFFLLKQHFQQHFLIEVLIIPIALMIIIILNDGINNNAGIVGAIAAFLTISYNVPKDETVIYVIQRVFDTFIGTAVAIGLNFFVKASVVEKKEEIDEDLIALRQKEADLIKIQKQIQDKIDAAEKNK